MGAEERSAAGSPVEQTIGVPWTDLQWSRERDLKESDFSESQAQFQQLHAISKQRQFSDERLRKLTDQELVFLAGHIASTESQGDAKLSLSAATANRKVVGNAVRAQYELDRRARAEAQLLTERLAERATAEARKTALLGASVGAAAALAVLILGSLLESPSAGDPPQVNVSSPPVEVTVTVVYPPTSTAPTQPPPPGP